MFRTKVVEKTETQIPFSFAKIVAFMMWENIVESGRSQMTIWRMRIACCATKATNKHSEYVMLFFLFSAVAMVERTRLIVNVYVRLLS